MSGIGCEIDARAADVARVFDRLDDELPAR